MSDEIEIQRRLEAIGQQLPAALTSDRRAAIEARVLAGVGAAQPAEGRSRWAPLLLTAAATIVIVLVVSLVFAAGDGPSRFEIADGVMLELPDGLAAAAVGDELPDGVVVDIGAGGQAVVDGERFGPGRYRIADGRLLPVATTTSSTPDGTDGAGDAPNVDVDDDDHHDAPDRDDRAAGYHGARHHDSGRHRDLGADAPNDHDDRTGAGSTDHDHPTDDHGGPRHDRLDGASGQQAGRPAGAHHHHHHDHDHQHHDHDGERPRPRPLRGPTRAGMGGDPAGFTVRAKLAT